MLLNKQISKQIAPLAMALIFNSNLIPAHAQPAFVKAKENKVYAQKLVNELLQQDTELLVVGMHSKMQGDKQSRLIASNLDRIGKKDDVDDEAVATERKIIIAPNVHGLNKIEVLLPLQDADGRVIGALGLVFKFHSGDDKVRILAKAVSLQKQLSEKIKSSTDLMRPETIGTTLERPLKETTENPVEELEPKYTYRFRPWIVEDMKLSDLNCVTFEFVSKDYNPPRL